LNKNEDDLKKNEDDLNKKKITKKFIPLKFRGKPFLGLAQLSPPPLFSLNRVRIRK
jgi:hypothetical protein